MTTNLTEAEKAFLEFDWSASDSWKQYHNNLFPSPPLNKLAKYKRTWFRREMDSRLPADSTVGDPEPDVKHTEPSSSTTQRKPGEKESTAPGQTATASSPKDIYRRVYPAKNVLVRLELGTRLLYLAATLISIFFTFIRLLPAKVIVMASKISTISFFLFLLISLLKDSTPRWSFEWVQSVFMNENMHYLSYGAAVLSLPKTLLFMSPQILTCIIGLEKLYKYHQASLPDSFKKGRAKEYFRIIEDFNSSIFRGRAMLEALALVHMFLGIFSSGIGILNFVLYANFIKLKISVHDVYLLAVFRQVNGTITNTLSNPIIPPVALTVYQTISDVVVKYFKPQRP